MNGCGSGLLGVTFNKQVTFPRQNSICALGSCCSVWEFNVTIFISLPLLHCHTQHTKSQQSAVTNSLDPQTSVWRITFAFFGLSSLLSFTRLKETINYKTQKESAWEHGYMTQSPACMNCIQPVASRQVQSLNCQTT